MLLDGTVDAIQRQVEVLTHGVIWTFKAFQDRFLAQKEPCALVGTSEPALREGSLLYRIRACFTGFEPALREGSLSKNF